MNRFFELFPFLEWKDIIIATDKSIIAGDIMVDDCYDNLINNPSFITGFNCWDTENQATYFTVAGKILLTDQMLLSSATNGAYVLVENGQTVLKLTEGGYITQPNSNLKEIVDFEAGPNTWFDIFYTKINVTGCCFCENIIFTNTIYFKITLYFIIDFHSIRPPRTKIFE